MHFVNFPQAQATNGPTARAFTKYVIPKSLQKPAPQPEKPAEVLTASPAPPTNTVAADNIVNLQRSVDSLTAALAASEKSAAAALEHGEDIRVTLEDALGAAQRETETLKLYYQDELQKLSGLVSAATAKNDVMFDELSALRSHFRTSQEYKNWRLSISKEAFQSLPAKLAQVATTLKTFSDQEVSIILEVSFFRLNAMCCAESSLTLLLRLRSRWQVMMSSTGLPCR